MHSLARRALVDYDPAGQRRPEFGRPASLFQHLHDANTPGTRALLQKFDAAADALGLDDDLLDLLLADLGLE